MPFDGSGSYTPSPAPNFPAIGGATISSTYYNNVINDIATALNNVLTRDGQGKPSAAINWNGQDLTNVAALSAVSAVFGTPLGTVSGGTGLDTHLAGNGQLLVGNGAGFTLANVTAGSGISVTNGAGTITIAATGGGMVYPGAGIAVSTGAAWGTSKAAPTGALVGDTDTQTLTGKTLNLANNTVTGTLAQFNTAVTDADLAAAGWTQIAQLTTTSGTSQTFTSIPQTYADLLVVPACSHNSGASESLRMDISDNNGSNWSGSFSTWGQAAADTIRGQIFIPGYRVGTGIIMGSCPALATNRTLNMRTSVSSGAFGLADWRADAGINALRFTNSGGAAFDTGTITLYGR